MAYEAYEDLAATMSAAADRVEELFDRVRAAELQAGEDAEDRRTNAEYQMLMTVSGGLHTARRALRDAVVEMDAFDG